MWTSTSLRPFCQSTEPSSGDCEATCFGTIEQPGDSVKPRYYARSIRASRCFGRSRLATQLSTVISTERPTIVALQIDSPSVSAKRTQVPQTTCHGDSCRGFSPCFDLLPIRLETFPPPSRRIVGHPQPRCVLSERPEPGIGSSWPNGLNRTLINIRVSWRSLKDSLDTVSR